MSDPIIDADCSDPFDAEPTVRAPTADEEAALAADQADATIAAAREQNRNTMIDRANNAIANLKAAADALDANTATAAQQRAALALCCRTTARLVRLALNELDQAD